MISASPALSSVSSLEKEPEPTVNASLPRRHWFHSVFFNLTIVGWCAFLSPGIFNSMSALGGGGRQEPYLANSANSIVFGLMVVTCYFGSTITNKIGYRWSVVLGTLGFFPYATGLYENKMKGTEWLVLFGAVCCGASAGLFWSVEGAMVMGYPEPRKRGRYLAYWLGFRNAGMILGGAINLGLNASNSKAGSISSSTYIVFIVLQAISPLVGFLVSNPSQVWRPDNSAVKLEKRQSFRAEMGDIWKVIKRKEILLLFPISLYAQWSSGYTGSFLTIHYSVRSRALGSFLVAVSAVIVNAILGFFLDNQSFSKKFKARSSYLTIMALLGGCWIWFTVLELKYGKEAVSPKFDWTDAGWAVGFVLYLIFNCLYFLLQNELYWTISQCAREPSELIQLSSLLRGLESAGSACAFGISASKQLPKTVPLGINFGLYGLALFTAWFTVKEIGVKFGLEEESKSEVEGRLEKIEK
ncbi:hypothetical protein JCM16303_000986 [Sporobolomyces ruberrimus]